jgi:hypothetical protein
MKWISIKDETPPKYLGDQMSPMAVKIAGEKPAFAYFGYKVATIPSEIREDKMVFKTRWGFMNFNLEFIENVTHWMMVPTEDE